MDDYKFFFDEFNRDDSIIKRILPVNKKEIEFRDPIVERVVDKFVSRSDHGYEKYGMTLHTERTEKVKGLFKYLTDVQEELMDAVLYIQAAREEIKDMLDGEKK